VIAERFRASVASASLHADLAVTVSVGTSQWDPGERAESAIGRADQALYAAKNGGRNRVA
jgi:PleD family two-component response regulator